jgi:LDH2 family malate/lactate/ureidoglycolate dehydrogenase
MESSWRDGMTEPLRYRPEDVHEFCRAILEKLKVPREDAKEVGDCLLQADLRGVDSHGMIRLPVYAERIQKGVVNSRPVPNVVRSNAATALLDGDNGLGAVVGSRAMEKAIELAADAGISFVGVRRSNHFGIAAFYVQKAVRKGLIGCAASNAPPHMAPFGGRVRFLGTNPLSVGIPAGKQPPLIFDASTSVVARGKIIVAAKEGKPIPPGWAIDPDGNPTTDAKAALAGSVLPFGGAKGSAISLLIDVLCGVLTGSAFGLTLNTLENLEAEQNLGHVFMAMRTDIFVTMEDFASRMDELLQTLKSSPPAPNTGQVLAPGEIERLNEARNREFGVPLLPNVVDQLAALGAELKVTFPDANTMTVPAETDS